VIRDARWARSPRAARARDGALACGLVVAGRWQGAADELMGAIGRAPSKAVRGGAHPSGGAASRRWRMLQATAFISGEGAPVASGDGGLTL
jgi:hypothetical protein